MRRVDLRGPVGGLMEGCGVTEEVTQEGQRVWNQGSVVLCRDVGCEELLEGRD